MHSREKRKNRSALPTALPSRTGEPSAALEAAPRVRGARGAARAEGAGPGPSATPPASRRHDDQAALQRRRGRVVEGGSRAGPLRTSPGRAGPRRRHSQRHRSRDYEKMVGQTRSKLKEAAPEPARSSRCAQPRRRRRATGAGEPEMEEPPAEAEKPQPPLPVGGGGNLPGGSRDYSPRRPRNLNPQNCMQMEVVAKTLLVGRFQFLSCLLEQLRDKVQQLRRRQVGSRTSVGIGEAPGPPRVRRDPRGAQRFSAACSPGRDPGEEAEPGGPAVSDQRSSPTSGSLHGACFSLSCVSAFLSLCVCLMNR